MSKKDIVFETVIFKFELIQPEDIKFGVLTTDFTHCCFEVLSSADQYQDCASILCENI